jgi:hypothetical protein
VNRLLVFALTAVSLGWSGCGTSFYVRGAINSQIIRGTVSAVEISIVTDSGVMLTVTLVTFLQGGNLTTVNFCGDQTSQFLPGQFVEASFTPGQPCASVLQIINGP